MLVRAVRIVRHAGLLLLILLLAGGPALRAAAQMSCAPQRLHCPMCEHRAERMDCMDGRTAAVRAMPSPASVNAAVFFNFVDSDCFCKAAPASQIEETRAGPSSLVDHAPVLAVAVEPAWPSIGEVAGRGVPAGAAVRRIVLRASVAAPLRV